MYYFNILKCLLYLLPIDHGFNWSQQLIELRSFTVIFTKQSSPHVCFTSYFASLFQGSQTVLVMASHRLFGHTISVHLTSVMQGFDWSVLAHPHATALTDATDGATITYSQLNDQVNRVARWELLVQSISTVSSIARLTGWPGEGDLLFRELVQSAHWPG